MPSKFNRVERTEIKRDLQTRKTLEATLSDTSASPSAIANANREIRKLNARARERNAVADKRLEAKVVEKVQAALAKSLADAKALFPSLVDDGSELAALKAELDGKPIAAKSRVVDSSLLDRLRAEQSKRTRPEDAWAKHWLGERISEGEKALKLQANAAALQQKQINENAANRIISKLSGILKLDKMFSSPMSLEDRAAWHKSFEAAISEWQNRETSDSVPEAPNADPKIVARTMQKFYHECAKKLEIFQFKPDWNAHPERIPLSVLDFDTWVYRTTAERAALRHAALILRDHMLASGGSAPKIDDIPNAPAFVQPSDGTGQTLLDALTLDASAEEHRAFNRRKAVIRLSQLDSLPAVDGRTKTALEREKEREFLDMILTGQGPQFDDFLYRVPVLKDGVEVSEELYFASGEKAEVGQNLIRFQHKGRWAYARNYAGEPPERDDESSFTFSAEEERQIRLWEAANGMPQDSTMWTKDTGGTLCRITPEDDFRIPNPNAPKRLFVQKGEPRPEDESYVHFYAGRWYQQTKEQLSEPPRNLPPLEAMLPETPSIAVEKENNEPLLTESPWQKHQRLQKELEARLGGKPQ